MPSLYNAPVTNPPALIAAGGPGAGVQNLGTLVNGAKYLVTLCNALEADRAGAGRVDVLGGWIKTGAAADVTAENGTPIDFMSPVEITPLTGKLVLSFIRNADTPFACKVFVDRTDA